MSSDNLIPQVLALAIIERAIEDFKGSFAFGNGKRRANTVKVKMRDEAKYWLTNYCDADLDIPCTFMWCCSTLGFEPSIIKKAVLTKTLPKERHRQSQFGSYCHVILSLTDSEPYRSYA